MNTGKRTLNQPWKFSLFPALALALMNCAAGQALSAQAQSGWAQTRTHAHPTENARMVTYLPGNEPVSITVVLQPRNRPQLDSLVTSLMTPGRPQFRHWLTHEQLLADHAPTQQQAQSVADYLVRMGFSGVRIATNRIVVTASGTADSARKAFNTELARFTRGGAQGIANTKDVQLPVELNGLVISVLGLQTLDQAHIAAVTTHDPVQFPVAYDATSLPAASGTAVGIITVGDMTQTISDLHQFESLNGLPTINPVVVNAGGSSTDTSGTIEWDLDSQDIQGMAGGQVGQMIFYTAASFSNAALTAAYNAAVSANVAKVINVSLGECERFTFSDGSMAADDAIFEMAIAQGQTFSVASGDWGSKECGSGQNGVSFGTQTGESYPASSPFVIAVGGTTLSTNSDNTYGNESAWTFSGGGPSLYEPQPGWQAGIVPGSTRGVPDIAFDANPSSGAVFVYFGSQISDGGTSLASPLFVGAWARLESAHGNTLGFPGPWLYSHGATPPASMFHDVTSGSNGDYSAGTGWDFVTGFGSLDVAGVEAALREGSWQAAVEYLLGL